MIMSFTSSGGALRALVLLGVLLPVTTLAGQRQPIVLQHGFQADGQSWDNTPSRLNVFHATPYLPTTGWSYRLGAQAVFLNNFFNNNNLPDTTIIVGHSNGGLISRNLGSMRRLNGLITIGTPHDGAEFANAIRDGTVEGWSTYVHNSAAYVEDIYDDLPATDADQFQYESANWAAFVQMTIATAMKAEAIRMRILDGSPVFVLQDMAPNSPFLDSLNFGASKIVQDMNIRRRLAITSRILHHSYMIWQVVFSGEHMQWTQLTDAAIIAQHEAYEFYQDYYDINDPLADEKRANAYEWELSQFALAGLDIAWCGFMGGGGGPPNTCAPSDGIVLRVSQEAWVGAQRDSLVGLSHTQEKTSPVFQDRLIFWLRDFGVPPGMTLAISSNPINFQPPAPGTYPYNGVANRVDGAPSTWVYEWKYSTDGTNYTGVVHTGPTYYHYVGYNSEIRLRLIARETSLGIRDSTMRIIRGPTTTPTASIEGPTEVPEYSRCQWIATTNVSGADYQWYVNGGATGETGQTFSWGEAQDFEISVHITNSEGLSVWAYLWVTVDEWSQGCA
jgi:pimeloyl-ACP methyl ester carboxylesterase